MSNQRPISTEERARRRAYSRGYAAGKRYVEPERDRWRQLATHAAQRAERLERGLGTGHCEDCVFWQRGGHFYAESERRNCAWGTCDAKQQAGTPWGTYMCADTGDRGAEIQTSPRFGCVLFKAKDP